MTTLPATRYHFGDRVFPRASKTDDVTVWLDRGKTFILDVPLREPTENIDLYDDRPVDMRPFELADFTRFDRLSWPAGGTAIPQNTKLRYWGQRYVAWIDNDTLSIIDATRPSVLSLTTSLFDSTYWVDLVHGGKLWLSPDTAIIAIELEPLVALFDAPPGPIEIRVRETYPRHRPGRFEAATIVAADATTASARATDIGRTYQVPRLPGLDVGVAVTLHDELYLHHWLAIEVAGYGIRPLYGPIADHVVERATLKLEPAIDPAGDLGSIHTEAPARQRDLDALFRELADQPDDVATRTVLLDALEEAGETYAPQLAALAATQPFDHGLANRALGPLLNYMQWFEYRNGLPYAATMTLTAPIDDAIADLVAHDLRLGLFTTLRLGRGPFRVYAKLIGSPRAVALRHVDVPNHHVLDALVAGGRTELRQISNVKFATREVIEGLGHATFDRVERIATETGADYVARLLAFVVRDEVKFFSRSPRHLMLTERANRDDELIDPVLAAWDKLPLAAVTVAGLTLHRDGTAVAAEATPFAIGKIRDRFRVQLQPT